MAKWSLDYWIENTFKDVAQGTVKKINYLLLIVVTIVIPSSLAIIGGFFSSSSNWANAFPPNIIVVGFVLLALAIVFPVIMIGLPLIPLAFVISFGISSTINKILVYKQIRHHKAYSIWYFIMLISIFNFLVMMKFGFPFS